ncbi:zinc ribbon domain-containing protein [Thermodesulfobacteriota bacterium]
MPIFEFRCIECGNIFEKLFMNSDEKMDMACPDCKSESFERVVSGSNFAMGSGIGEKQSQITTKSCGPANQCVTVDLPGHTK